MKKYLYLIGMILLLVPAASVKAQEKTPPPPPMHRQWGGMMMGHRLNLTADQRSKMQDLRLELTKEMIPLRAQIKEKEADLKLQITSDKYDASTVNKTLDQISALQKQVRLKMIEHMRSVRDLLTPDQQKQFDMMVLNGHQWQHRAMVRNWGMRDGHGMMRPDHPMPPQHEMNNK